MTVAALVAAVLVGIALPHLLALGRADPATAIVLWATALGLRALLVVATLAAGLVVLHPGDLIAAVAAWPCAPHHHVVGHVLAVAGALGLTFSLTWALARVMQAALAVRDVLRAPLGRGPGGSLIVGGEAVVLAAAGLRRPRVVVSAGALARLDDAELAAALAHEHAHIRRCHRYVLLYAEVCRVLGRPLPGTMHAVRSLRFQLERDADRCAARSRADRLALASAICKAAGLPASRPEVATLAGEGTADRVRELLDVAHQQRRGGLRAVASVVVALAVGVALALPAAISGLDDPVALCAA